VLKRYHGETGPASSGFDILPAIDLRGGRVVRLRQGDFGQETVYGDDPAAVAQRFAADGAEWLHIVDLDGARAGERRNADAVRRIIERVGDRVRCEVAGGLRSEEAVDRAFAAGAARVIVGTAALRDPSLAARLVERHGPERIAAAIDVRGGRALGEGWRPGAPGLTVEDAIELLAEAGVTTFEVTAIDRDGLLGGPDLALLERAVARRRGATIASGGIARLEDLAAIRAIGCSGAIVGRALYEGRFTIAEAILALARES
jgi:phosphoribosylformimino-5-aminoimidazole carboxamide ribotide isomerase